MSEGSYANDLVLTKGQRAKLAEFLAPGEEVVVAVPAESGVSYLVVLVGLVLRSPLLFFLRFLVKDWLVVRTDGRVLLFRTRGGGIIPRTLEAEYPLDIIVEFRRSGVWLRLTLAGSHYRVSGQYRRDLEVLTGVREREPDKPRTLECPACGVLNYEDASRCQKCLSPLQPG
jgi:hypothetical protein